MMGCECCKEVNPKDYDKCHKDMAVIKARRATSAKRYVAPCGEEFKFGAKFTASKSKKRKKR